MWTIDAHGLFPWLIKKLITAFERNLRKNNLEEGILEIGFCFPTCSPECAAALPLLTGTPLQQGWFIFAFQMQWTSPVLLREMLRGKKSIFLVLKSSRSV